MTADEGLKVTLPKSGTDKQLSNGLGARLAARAMRKGLSPYKPLVPLTEGKRAVVSPRIAQAIGSDAVDMSSEGASGARGGRQFTVANVGNNGRIYLKPSARLDDQKRVQPSANMPITPPGTTGFFPKGTRTLVTEHGSDLQSLGWTPTTAQSPLASSKSFLPNPRNLIRPSRHRRAMSDSTVHDTATPRSHEIEHPVTYEPNLRERHRPRTMDGLDIGAVPTLNINIPSWRIGTPRFTLRGTPVIRGSSYAPTEDFRLSNVSVSTRLLQNYAEEPLGSNWKGPLEDVPPIYTTCNEALALSPSSQRLLKPIHLESLASTEPIDPAMFTDLTFKPGCDDRSIVRYSPTSKSVTAATPSRLVAEITSPSFLDYELLSDFFLTYRSFLEPLVLVQMVIARLRWALARQDEVGLIVRVRTFVAIRHWILNYFMDDFVFDFNLRAAFCDLLNDVVQDLSEHSRTRDIQLRIILELKKCWRRICAHYWDSAKFEETLGVEVPIVPGGIAGNRDATLDPTTLEGESKQPPQLSPSFFHSIRRGSEPFSESIKTAQISDFVVFDNRPTTPRNFLDVHEDPDDHASPISAASLDVLSCSFPNKGTRNLACQSSPSAAHPVPVAMPISQPGLVATTPRALIGKRVRPAYSHKRSNSMSDSLREHIAEQRLLPDKNVIPPMSSAGSLVRGNLLPPGQAFVDTVAAEHGSATHRHTTTLISPGRKAFFKDKTLGGAMSASGMKKLIGNVRRALSTRGQFPPPSQANLVAFGATDYPEFTSSRLPGTAIVPQDTIARNGSRPAVRIDLLGAEVAEDFKAVVKEGQSVVERDAEVEHSIDAPMEVPVKIGYIHDPTTEPAMFNFSKPQHEEASRPLSDTGITTGSQSIVIVDATTPFEMQNATQPEPGGHPSVSTFTETFMPPACDPTPPNTPPLQSEKDTPRRSSHLLNPQIVQQSILGDDLPPFIPDLDTLDGESTLGGSNSKTHSSLPAPLRLRQHPPLSGGAFRMHRKNRSSRLKQPLVSIVQRRYSSGLPSRRTLGSSDGASKSTTSLADHDFDVPTPAPLRVLRRRPGGDLRAAEKVGELANRCLRTSQSVGSLDAYTDSMRSSFVGSTVDSYGALVLDGEDSEGQPRLFSVGQLAHRKKLRGLSRSDSQLSKPPMRFSFEAEAKKLAEISDNEDDGGIESALLKLEGKYDQKASKSARVSSGNTDEDLPNLERMNAALEILAGKRPHKMTKKEVSLNAESVEDAEGNGPRDASISALYKQLKTEEVTSYLSDASRESYSSIPLLNRDLGDSAYNANATHDWVDKTAFCRSENSQSKDQDKQLLCDEATFDEMQHRSDGRTIAGLENAGSFANRGAESKSYLEDESSPDTDLSSELSIETAPHQGHNEGFPSYPLQDAYPRTMLVPASPATTPRQAVSPAQPLFPTDTHFSEATPPTPNATPTAPCNEKLQPSQINTDSEEVPKGSSGPNLRKFSVHLPFILAFDSDVLAQQFTLIEKDALNEMDWKDLIEMNWKNSASCSSRSWVDFLRNSNAHGVEVVIARFNIMVKWAISEIVLTQHVEERAQCIIKMIHIAAQCRRQRNFATLAQLTFALTSNEVTRLYKTWELVPACDIRTLDGLETLVTPTRNFYNLRAEMEVGSDTGCIPFVGIYTHDLLYNAQRPLRIASSLPAAPLVNFERCRIAAAVVKVLLRLLEASTKYTFRPIEGVTERCLWVGALNDEDIRRHSESLE